MVVPAADVFGQPGHGQRGQGGDLGPDFYDTRIDKDRHARNLARQLQHITGQQLQITDGQLVIADPPLAEHRPGSADAPPGLPPAHSHTDFRVGWLTNTCSGRPSGAASSAWSRSRPKTGSPAGSGQNRQELIRVIGTR